MFFSRSLSNVRGASAVEYMVLVAMVLGAIAAAAGVYAPSIGAGAACEASRIATALGLGGGSPAACGGGEAARLSADARPMGAAAAQASPRGGLVCGPMGCTSGSGNCFAPGTLVSTEHGPRVIEQITEGDRVWARDEANGETALRQVVHVMRRQRQPLARIEIVSASGVEVIKVTAEHPFFVRGKGWTLAQALAPDDLLEAEHDAARVAAVASTSEIATVHNLEIEGFHTYFVGRAGALVHNQCAGRVRPPAPDFAPLGNGGGVAGIAPAVHQLWRDLAQIDGLSVRPANNAVATPFDFTAGWARTRTDFYGVVVTMPARVTPEAFLYEMQQDPHGVTGNDAGFHSWVTWDRPPTNPRPQGDVVDLAIYGDPGAIMYVGTVDGRPGSPLSFGVITVSNAKSGTHPVSGYRYWGLTPIPRQRVDAHDTGRPQQYVLWTSGIDSGNVAIGGRIGSWMQEGTWSAYLASVAREVQRRGGTSSPELIYGTTAQYDSLRPNNTDIMIAPTLQTWRYPATGTSVPRSEDPRYQGSSRATGPSMSTQEREIRRYANSCTSDRRYCSGALGAEARRILDGPAPDFSALRLPPQEGLPPLVLGAPVEMAEAERRLIAQRGRQFYADHGAAPGSCGNCHR